MSENDTTSYIVSTPIMSSSAAFTKFKQYRLLKRRMIATTPRQVEQCVPKRKAINTSSVQHSTALSRSALPRLKQSAPQEAMNTLDIQLVYNILASETKRPTHVFLRITAAIVIVRAAIANVPDGCPAFDGLSSRCLEDENLSVNGDQDENA
jgi:hypothetical protein